MRSISAQFASLLLLRCTDAIGGGGEPRFCVPAAVHHYIAEEGQSANGVLQWHRVMVQGYQAACTVHGAWESVPDDGYYHQVCLAVPALVHRSVHCGPFLSNHPSRVKST